MVKKREYDESEACINIHASGNPAHTHADALNHHLLCRPPPIIYGMSGCRRWDVAAHSRQGVATTWFRVQTVFLLVWFIGLFLDDIALRVTSCSCLSSLY